MLKDLIKEKARLEQELLVVEAQLANVMADISDLMSLQLAEVRRLQDKEFGAVNVTSEGFKVTETIPKRVKWDQEVLGDLFFKIMKHGDKPSNYMKMKLEVPERMYDEMSPEIQGLFSEARTVERGKPVLKIEEVE